MARVLLLLGCGMMRSLLGLAQPTQVPAAERELMQQASFIFEGELVRTVSYLTPDSSRLFYASLVRLLHPLKGALPFDSVQVVYPGIRIMAIRRNPQTGEMTFLKDIGPLHGPNDTWGSTPLPAGQRVVLFCRLLPAHLPAPPPHLTKGKAPGLERVGAAWEQLPERTIVSNVGGPFPDFPAFYRYLAQQYQVRN